jgi:hypothetical protein
LRLPPLSVTPSRRDGHRRPHASVSHDRAPRAPRAVGEALAPPAPIGYAFSSGRPRTSPRLRLPRSRPSCPACRRGGACASRLWSHSSGPALSTGRGVRGRLKRFFPSQRRGDIGRGGRGLPSIVGRGRGRGTRHAAGPPPQTPAPTAPRGRVEAVRVVTKCVPFPQAVATLAGAGGPYRALEERDKRRVRRR